jgi:hypothetical protein
VSATLFIIGITNIQFLPRISIILIPALSYLVSAPLFVAGIGGIVGVVATTSSSLLPVRLQKGALSWGILINYLLFSGAPAEGRAFLGKGKLC